MRTKSRYNINTVITYSSVHYVTNYTKDRTDSMNRN